MDSFCEFFEAAFGNTFKCCLSGGSKEAEAAVTHSYGVIETNDNNPAMQSNSTLSFTYHNPINSISSADGYEEDVMGASMDAYLNGFGDPRISVFFQLSSNDNYRGLRNGHKNGDIFKGDLGLSKPNILQGTPYVWMTAAEVYFCGQKVP